MENREGCLKENVSLISKGYVATGYDSGTLVEFLIKIFDVFSNFESLVDDLSLSNQPGAHSKQPC